MAFEVEADQIRSAGLQPLVSITDHDTIAAPQLLRSVDSARGIPVSLEWTVPFGRTEFHLGVHNLPSAEAYAWMTRLAAYTAAAAPAEGEPATAPGAEQLGMRLGRDHALSRAFSIGFGEHLDARAELELL